MLYMIKVYAIYITTIRISVMNSLQLAFALRPVSNSIVKRYAFTQKDRIISFNFQNKNLYGPVIKKKPSKKSKQTEPTIQNIPSESADVASTLKKPESNYDSEMYWIVGKRLNEVADKNVPRTSKIQRKNVANEKTTELKKEQSGKIIEQKVIDVNIGTPPAIIQKAIPLTNEELENVLKHPLQSSVLSTPPTDIRAPELRNVPSVGKVLQYTMPEAARNALLNWKLAKISELGEQGFADLQQSNLSSGAKFHWSIQQYFLNNETPTDSSPVYKLWESVRGVLNTFTAMPVSVEKTVFHPTLKYKGICDCVSEVDNQLTIIEWKKSGRSKPTLDATYDAPLQLCAYLGAMNSIPELHGRIRQGMVVVAYENGQQADVYKMNEVMLRKYWRVWLGRLHEFWIRSRDDTLPEPI